MAAAPILSEGYTDPISPCRWELGQRHRRMVWAWRRASLTGPLYGRGLRPPVKTHGSPTLEESRAAFRTLAVLYVLSNSLPSWQVGYPLGLKDLEIQGAPRQGAWIAFPRRSSSLLRPPISETQMTLYSVLLDVICPSLGVSLGLGIQESCRFCQFDKR
jgi:hypothetical protein